MTTFYHYEKDGTVATSDLDSAAQTFVYGPSDPGRAYEERGDSVGAFLARRNVAYRSSPAFLAPHVQVPSHMVYDSPYTQSVNQAPNHSAASKPINQDHYPNDGYDASDHAHDSHLEDSSDTIGYAGWPSQSSVVRPYPNPDQIRHLHTLQSLLPNLQPDRKLNALGGPAIDIIEQDTGVKFAYQVPKKLLILFLGRRVVTKFIRTIRREDDENWRGGPTAQEMALPRGKSSKSAVQMLLAWMTRACEYHTSTITQISAPTILFVACSLAQTMELFGLYKDAMRIDHHITQTHFARPIFAVELESLWNCLGEDNRYVYAAIKIVAVRLQEHEKDSTEAVKGTYHDMLALLEENPRLETRVRDLALNEKYRPVFNTIWTSYLGTNMKDYNKGNNLASEGHGLISLEKGCPDDRATNLLGQKPQSVSPADVVDEFSVLRIVPESARRSWYSNPAILESRHKAQEE